MLLWAVLNNKVRKQNLLAPRPLNHAAGVILPDINTKRSAFRWNTV